MFLSRLHSLLFLLLSSPLSLCVCSRFTPCSTGPSGAGNGASLPFPECCIPWYKHVSPSFRVHPGIRSFCGVFIATKRGQLLGFPAIDRPYSEVLRRDTTTATTTTTTTTRTKKKGRRKSTWKLLLNDGNLVLGTRKGFQGLLLLRAQIVKFKCIFKKDVRFRLAAFL